MTDRLPAIPPARVARSSLTNPRASTNRAIVRNRRAPIDHRWRFRYEWIGVPADELIDVEGFAQSKLIRSEAFEIDLPAPYDRVRAGQNIFRNSEAFDGGQWVKSGSPTITPNVSVAPDGTTTADRIEDTNTSGYQYVHQSWAISPLDTRTYTGSVFIKKAIGVTSFALVRLRFQNGPIGIVSYDLQFNAETGVYDTNPSGVTEKHVRVIDYDANWWRVAVTGNDLAENPNVYLYLYPAAGACADPTECGFSNSGVGALDFWGAQLEIGPLTDYYPHEYPIVDGAGQTGRELLTTRWPIGKPSTLIHEGDLIQIRGAPKVYAVTEDLVIDGAGNATLKLNSDLISSPADSDEIDICARVRPKMVIETIESIPQRGSNLAHIKDLSLAMIEDPL